MTTPVQVNYPETTLQVSKDTGGGVLSTSTIKGESVVLSLANSGTVQIKPTNVSMIDGLATTDLTTQLNLGNLYVGSSLNNTRATINSKSLTISNFGATTTNFFLNSSSITSNATTFDMSFNSLTLNGTANNASGQILMANASGKPYWATLPNQTTSTISSVLVAGNNASYSSIFNISSLTLNSNLSPGVDSIQFTQVAQGLAINCSTKSVILDESKSTKAFTGNYLRVSVNGTNYRLQLFADT